MKFVAFCLLLVFSSICIPEGSYVISGENFTLKKVKPDVKKEKSKYYFYTPGQDLGNISQIEGNIPSFTNLPEGYNSNIININNWYTNKGVK